MIDLACNSRTVVLIKPDAVKNGLVEEITDTFTKGLGLSGPAAARVFFEGDPRLFSLFLNHYKEHAAKPWYLELVRDMSDGPIVALRYDGPSGSVAIGREILAGVRRNHGTSDRQNAAHASDTHKAGEREANIWFSSENLVRVKFQKLRSDAVEPTRAHWDGAGFDITAVDVKYDEPRGILEYRTGLVLEIPVGHVGLLFPPSSIAKTQNSACNAVGVIDAGNRDEVIVSYRELPMGPYWEKRAFEKYNKGDKVARLVVLPIPLTTFEEVGKLTLSQNGVG